MGGVLDWSTTPGSNTSVDGVNIAEGMQPGLVNNGMRAIMSLVREWQLDASGVVTAGTSDAYTMTSNQGIAAYSDGLRFSVRADRNNTGAATLNVDGRGAKALRKAVGGALVALAADDIVADAIYDVVYDLSSDVFVIVGPGLPTISAFALTLLDDADAGAARTTLGAQASDATLTSLSGLSLVQGDILYATAADTLQRLAKGTAGQVLAINTGATAPEWVTAQSITFSGPTATTSGATVNLSTVIPSGVRRITGLLRGVSVADNSAELRVRVGSGSFLTTGYVATAWGNNSSIATATNSFVMTANAGAALVYNGRFTLTHMGSNNWLFDSNLAAGGESVSVATGQVALSGALDRVQLFSATSTYDLGEAAIMWEF